MVAVLRLSSNAAKVKDKRVPAGAVVQQRHVRAAGVSQCETVQFEDTGAEDELRIS